MHGCTGGRVDRWTGGRVDVYMGGRVVAWRSGGAVEYFWFSWLDRDGEAGLDEDYLGVGHLFGFLGVHVSVRPLALLLDGLFLGGHS